MTIDHPDDEPVDDIEAYLKKISVEAEPADHDRGYGYHPELEAAEPVRANGGSADNDMSDESEDNI